MEDQNENESIEEISCSCNEKTNSQDIEAKKEQIENENIEKCNCSCKINREKVFSGISATVRFLFSLLNVLIVYLLFITVLEMTIYPIIYGWASIPGLNPRDATFRIFGLISYFGVSVTLFNVVWKLIRNAQDFLISLFKAIYNCSNESEWGSVIGIFILFLLQSLIFIPFILSPMAFFFTFSIFLFIFLLLTELFFFCSIRENKCDNSEQNAKYLKQKNVEELDEKSKTQSKLRDYFKEFFEKEGKNLEFGEQYDKYLKQEQPSEDWEKFVKQVSKYCEYKQIDKDNLEKWSKEEETKWMFAPFHQKWFFNYIKETLKYGTLDLQLIPLTNGNYKFLSLNNLVDKTAEIQLEDLNEQIQPNENSEQKEFDRKANKFFDNFFCYVRENDNELDYNWKTQKELRNNFKEFFEKEGKNLKFGEQYDKYLKQEQHSEDWEKFVKQVSKYCEYKQIDKDNLEKWSKEEEETKWMFEPFHQKWFFNYIKETLKYGTLDLQLLPPYQIYKTAEQTSSYNNGEIQLNVNSEQKKFNIEANEFFDKFFCFVRENGIKNNDIRCDNLCYEGSVSSKLIESLISPAMFDDLGIPGQGWYQLVISILILIGIILGNIYITDKDEASIAMTIVFAIFSFYIMCNINFYDLIFRNIYFIWRSCYVKYKSSKGISCNPPSFTKYYGQLKRNHIFCAYITILIVSLGSIGFLIWVVCYFYFKQYHNIDELKYILNEKVITRVNQTVMPSFCRLKVENSDFSIDDYAAMTTLTHLYKKEGNKCYIDPKLRGVFNSTMKYIFGENYQEQGISIMCYIETNDPFLVITSRELFERRISELDKNKLTIYDDQFPPKSNDYFTNELCSDGFASDACQKLKEEIDRKGPNVDKLWEEYTNKYWKEYKGDANIPGLEQYQYNIGKDDVIRPRAIDENGNKINGLHIVVGGSIKNNWGIAYMIENVVRKYLPEVFSTLIPGFSLLRNLPKVKDTLGYFEEHTVLLFPVTPLSSPEIAKFNFLMRNFNFSHSSVFMVGQSISASTIKEYSSLSNINGLAFDGSVSNERAQYVPDIYDEENKMYSETTNMRIHNVYTDGAFISGFDEKFYINGRLPSKYYNPSSYEDACMISLTCSATEKYYPFCTQTLNKGGKNPVDEFKVLVDIVKKEYQNYE